MFSFCFSNPDLRRSELSLDAMLQKTSSNSSSSSSPSSQGGSAERRGKKKNALICRCTHRCWRINICLHCNNSKPVPALTFLHYAERYTHILIYLQGIEFQRLSAGHCQSQFCSDQPVWCALLFSASGEIEARKWEKVDRDRHRGICHPAGQRDICDIHGSLHVA